MFSRVLGICVRFSRYVSHYVICAIWVVIRDKFVIIMATKNVYSVEIITTT